jgi:excisionase family DNA binding protein
MTTGLNTNIEKLYNIDQISKLLGVSKITIYRLVESRKIPFYKIKGCIRFSETDIKSYLNSIRVEPV